MKKIATVVLVLALALGMVAGCATLTKVGEWIGVAAEKVCNFSMADSDEAQAAKKFIVATAGGVGLVLSTVTVAGVKIDITEAKAAEIFDSVTAAAQSGTCILLTDLQVALAYFDQVSAVVAQEAATKGLPTAKAIPAVKGLKAKAKM